MTIGIEDLSGVDAWKGGAILPPGRHLVEIDDCTEGKSSNQHPQIEASYRAVTGDYEGGTLRDWIVITAGSLGRVRAFLEAAGVDIPQGSFQLDVNKLIGKRLYIVAANEPYNGQDRTKVKGYEKADQASSGNGAQAKTSDIPF